MKRIMAAIAFLMGLALIVGPIEQSPGSGKPRLTGLEALAGRVVLAPATALAQQTGKAATYSDVAAIISKYHCTVCHGGSDPRDGLSLESYAKILKGGKDGPVVIAGKPGISELVRRIKGLSEPRMPYTGPPWLTDDEIGRIEQWISAGAAEGK
jgi:hypothetical protein